MISGKTLLHSFMFGIAIIFLQYGQPVWSISRPQDPPGPGFREEIVSELKSLRRSWNPVEIDYHGVYRGGLADAGRRFSMIAEERGGRNRIVCNRNCHFFDFGPDEIGTDRDDSINYRRVYLCGRKYRAFIEWSRGPVPNLTFLEDSRQPASHQFKDLASRELIQFSPFWLRRSTMALDQLLEHPSLRIRSSVEEGQSIKVTFDCDVPNGVSPDGGTAFRVVSGEVAFMTGPWRLPTKVYLQEANSSGAPARTVQLDWNYFGGIGCPRPCRLVVFERIEGALNGIPAGVASLNEIDFIGYQFSDANGMAPDSRFTLSEFGLPEPPMRGYRSGSWLFAWISALAGILIGCVFLASRKRFGTAPG